MRISRNQAESRSTWGDSFSQLEQRTLLSGYDSGAVTAFMDWHGVNVEVVPNSWVVTFEGALGRDGARDRVLDIASRLGVQAADVQVIGQHGYYASFRSVGVFHEADVDRVRAQFGNLIEIEPNLIYHTDRVPNDPLFAGQWPLLNSGQNIPGSGAGVLGADIHATQAWDTTIGSENVIVAIIDTGVDYNHQDLATNIWRNPGEIPGNGIDDDGNGFIDDVRGYDFANGDNDPMDFAGHGTSGAGCIGAVGDNGVGVAGVNWTVSILPVKVFPDIGGGAALANIIAGHDYLTDLINNFHYNIVASNNSYGAFLPAFFNTFRGAEEQAIQRFTNTGATFVAAAGNNANNNDADFTSFPASYANPEIISVAATNNQDGLANFSNWGLSTVDFGAPGVSCLTTDAGGGYVYISGTSFSSPYTAGAIGLLKAHKPDASQEEIKRALIEGCDPLPALQGRTVSGGRLNIANSMRLIDIEGPRVVSIFPGPVASNVNIIRVQFDRPLTAAALDASFIALRRANGDGLFNGNDVTIPVDNLDVTLSGAVVTIDLADEFPAGFPVDDYQLTLDAHGFRDFNGNYLNGTTAPPTAGNNEVYAYRIVVSSGAFEPNDTVPQATPVIFDVTGVANFAGAAIGDGTSGALDVDIYRFELSGPALIVATIAAQNLPSPSALDSYLRLFNAAGAQLAFNDNFNGLDSRIEFFVPTGGVYFVGVSGFGNGAYNPLVLGTSLPQSNGDYALTIAVDLAATDTNSYDSTHTPIPIPAIGTINDTIQVADNRTIVDINVRLDITHTFDGNLQIQLISPSGTVINLVMNRGGSGDNFVSTVLDDESATSIGFAAAPFTGSFRPEVPLSTLDGQSAAGAWRLRITDTQPLDSGTLVGWGIDLVVANDVFGPFELNDTVGLATPTGISGSGNRTVNAFVGDGAFGLHDIDLYVFEAASGSTLTASVAASGNLNSVLRLFDVAGHELIIDNRSDSSNSSLEFAIQNGGTFYIGVSGGPNVAYDVFTGGSGVATAGTGSYTLTITVTGGISVGKVVLDGTALDMGIAADGSIGVTSPSRTGLALNGIDFLVPQEGDPAIESYFGGMFNGFIFRNDGTNSDLQVAVANESDFNNRRASIDGLFRGLGVHRTFTYGVNDPFVAVDITLTNTTIGTTFTNVAWMEGFNPETGLNRRTPLNRTFNNVQNATGRLVTGAFFDNDYPGGLTVGIGAANPAALGTSVHTAVVDPGSIRDPFQIIDDATPDPDPAGDTGLFTNQTLAIAYSLGTLLAGESISFRYFIFLGTSTAAVDTLFTTMDQGAGTGHLEFNPLDASIPAEELPYVAYYPEGYANSRASTFVPITNPNLTDTRVVVIAHYERSDTGPRDQVLADMLVPAHTRSGITLTTPELYAANTQLVRKDEPYALEIRSTLPVGANLSHFDFGVATGESFSTTTSRTWTFGEGFRVPLPADGSEPSVNDFIVFYNTTAQTINVTVTIYPEQGGAPVSLTKQIEGFRRGGYALAHELAIPNGPFGIKVEAEQPIVAALTHFDTNIGGGFGVLGTPNLGSLTGVTPEGQLGINASSEFVTVLNANNAPAHINFTFFFANGSSYRQMITVPADHRGGFSVGALPAFPTGQQSYSIAFDSDQPVTVTLPSFSHGEATGSEFAQVASTMWLFADGFRPLAGGQVTEYLRLYNPSASDVTVEITITFNDGGKETFRRDLHARGSNEFNIHDFVTGDRATIGTVPGVGSFYGLTVRSPIPVVAYMGHFDANFFGGFGTLGMPMGNVGAVL